MQIKFTDAGRSTSKTPWETMDCTIRAYSIVHNVPYDVVHELAEKKGRVPHTQQLNWFYRILEERQADWIFYPGIKVSELADMLSGRFVCRYPGHVFALIDGVRHDIKEETDPLYGDGGDPRIYEVWKIE